MARRADAGAGFAGRAHRSDGDGHATSNGQRSVSSVAFRNVPSFVWEAGLPVKFGGRTLPVDVAFGGAFYAIVDAEAAGLAIDAGTLAELRRVGMEIKREVERLRQVVHPEDAGLHGIYGTIFTAPAQHPDAHLRNVTIFADAEVDRSPCGTGTAAVMAVLSEMGVLTEDAPFVHESIVGTLFTGRIVGRRPVGDQPAIVPEIQGSAWITGEHTFLIDGDDPLERASGSRGSSIYFKAVASFVPHRLLRCANSCSTLMSSMLLPSIVTRNRLATTRLSSPSLFAAVPSLEARVAADVRPTSHSRRTSASRSR